MRMKKIQVLRHGIVYRNSDSPFGYQGWPSICKLDDGSLAAVWSGFRVAHVCPYGKTAMSVSRDEGETWAPPMVVNDTPLDDRDAGIVNLGDGKLLITWFCHPKRWMLEHTLPRLPRRLAPALSDICTGYKRYYKDLPEPLGKGGSFVRTSFDNGVTWGETMCLPISSPHGPTRLKDGTLLYLGKDHFVETENIAAYTSTDDGLTWKLLRILDMPEGIPLNRFHEPHCIELKDGTLLGGIRVHGDDYFSVYLTRSADKGRNWTVPEPLIPEGRKERVCGSPPHLLLHSSGAIICSIGRREEPFGERVLISHDEGLHWEEYSLDVDAASSDLGYPATVELADGSLLTVYYQKYGSDSMTSILYTKWKL